MKSSSVLLICFFPLWLVLLFLNFEEVLCLDPTRSSIVFQTCCSTDFLLLGRTFQSIDLCLVCREAIVFKLYGPAFLGEVFRSILIYNYATHQTFKQ